MKFKKSIASLSLPEKNKTVKKIGKKKSRQAAAGFGNAKAKNDLSPRELAILDLIDMMRDEDYEPDLIMRNVVALASPCFSASAKNFSPKIFGQIIKVVTSSPKRRAS
jgi:hypothetical protein